MAEAPMASIETADEVCFPARRNEFEQAGYSGGSLGSLRDQGGLARERLDLVLDVCLMSSCQSEAKRSQELLEFN